MAASNGVAQQQHHSHHSHLGHSHKASGYAFSLNLCRSLGLWAPNAPFPSSIQKPQYLPLNPSNQSVDWDELLRKFSKHNSSQAAHVVAASTRLELIIWRALQLQSGSATHNTQPRSRKTSIIQSQGLETDGTAAASFPRDFLLDSTTKKKDIDLQIQELQKAVTLTGGQTPESTSHTAVLGLAYFSIGDTSESAQCLRIQQGASAPFTAAPDAPTHELDLQILSIVLKGLLQEHAGQTENAIATYRSLPCSPLPPVPEAQRYIEVGLSRLAELQRDSSSLEAHRNYLALTSSFTNVSPHKRLNMYTTYLSTLLSRIAEHYIAEHSHHSNQANINPPDTSDLFTTFKSYENLLQSSPSLASFPRAGEPTLNMIQYLDLLYGFWRYSLLPSEWVVESLNRCFTKTYANQKLLRCLVFVLATMSFSSSDRPKARKWAIDALKNMRLYIGLFEKTRETDQAAIKREIIAFRRRQNEDGSIEAGPSHSASGEQEDAAEIETDENFCYVCCIGTRLLLWESGQDNLQEQEDARLDLISEALEVINKAKKYMDKQAGGAIDGPEKNTGKESSNKDQPIGSEPPRLGPQGRVKSEVVRQRSEVEAEVLLWLGVAKVESALAEADLEQGKARAKEALQCLSSAARTVPAVNARDEDAENSHRASLRTRSLYSLAYSHLELRDVASALPIAKKAVESLHQQEPGVQLEASDVRVWHLLVLILTAMKEWNRAKEVVELALHGWSDFITEESVLAPPAPLSSLPTFVRQKSAALTRGDAPYDPAAIGGVQPVTQSNQAPKSSVRVPLDQKAALNGETEDDSSTPSFLTPQATSEQSSQCVGSSPLSRRHGVGRFVTQKLTSDWDDLEAEIELLITRNRCIEAIEGPEYALQDLQKTVFTRFSKRREELEAGSSALQAIIALSPEPTSPQAASKPSTYPYASKDMRNKVPNVQFQQDGNASGSNSPSRARSIIGSISLRHRSHSIKKTNTTQSQATGRLAVPSENGRPASVTSTISGNPSYEDVNAQTSPRAPSIVTNIEGSGSDTPSSGPQARVQRHHPRAARLLSKLWLTSAASFRRWGKYSECLGAINEAEDVAGNVDPNVWVQYAQYLTTSTGSLQNERAQLALQKAFAISTDHVPSILALSTIRIDAGDMAIAEGFLDVATQTNAWDSPEAWYLLAKVYEQTRRQKRARECLLYALDLEETRPIRDLRHTLDRYL